MSVGSEVQSLERNQLLYNLYCSRIDDMSTPLAALPAADHIPYWCTGQSGGVCWVIISLVLV